MDVDEVRDQHFSSERHGYSMRAVDHLLDEVALALDRGQRIGRPIGGWELPVGRRGYSRAEVDAFLTRIDDHFARRR